LLRTGIRDGVRPVGAAVWLNLLDRRFGLAGAKFMKKLESITFGPDLPDGRQHRSSPPAAVTASARAIGTPSGRALPAKTTANGSRR
jgi:hypothetical protein